MKDKLYEVLKLVLCGVIFFCVGDISKFTLSLFGLNIDKISNVGMVVYQLVLSIIMLVSLCLFYYKNIKKDFLVLKKDLNNNVTYIIKIFIIFMVVKYIVSFISVLIMTLIGFDTTSMTSVNQNVIEDYVKTAPILMFISTVVCAPIYEEVLFRLGLSKVIKNKWLFILVSGFIFGVMHVFPLEDGISFALGVMQSVGYVTMGIFLAFIYYKKQNIFSSIGVHFLNNLLSILVMINMI